MSDASGKLLIRYECRIRKHANPAKLETIIVEAVDFEGLIQKLQNQNYLLVSSEEIAAPGSQVNFF